MQKSIHGDTIGRRIHVIGNSCSGKSTLAAKIARHMDLPLVEIDALNWQPNWIGLNATDPERLTTLLSEATCTDSWVVAGSYLSFSKMAFWERLQTLIWLDLPLPVLIYRVIVRSWKRWRSRELLWGTNYERFWNQFMIWKKGESLVWWILTQHRRKRKTMISLSTSEEWRHIQFIRLSSTRQIRSFCDELDIR